MPTTGTLTSAQKRRLNRMFRVPGDVRAGDIIDILATQVELGRLVGQATNLSVLNHVVFVAPVGITLTGVKLIFEVADVGGATTASHTFTIKKNNVGTIASLVSVASIAKGVVTDIGTLDATQKILVAGDTVTLDIVTGSTAAASQNGSLVFLFKTNFVGGIGTPIP